MQPRSCQEGERSRESACLQYAFTPLAGARRRQRRTRSMVHGKNRIPYRIDRRLTGLAGPDYDATISFGLPLEPEDSQYGAGRVQRCTHRIAFEKSAHNRLLGEKHWIVGVVVSSSPFGISGCDCPFARSHRVCPRLLFDLAGHLDNLPRSGRDNRRIGHPRSQDCKSLPPKDEVAKCCLLRHPCIAGPGCSAGRVGVAGGVRHAAQTAGVKDGQARQA